MSVKVVDEGKDVFMWLLMGFEESLCYQILPVVIDHKLGLIDSRKSSTVLVVSPLVSLVLDQLQRLQYRDAKASIVTSGTGIMAASKKLLATDSSVLSDSILFCVPESLVKSRWREAFEDLVVLSRIVAVII